MIPIEISDKNLDIILMYIHMLIFMFSLENVYPVIYAWDMKLDFLIEQFVSL